MRDAGASRKHDSFGVKGVNLPKAERGKTGRSWGVPFNNRSSRTSAQQPLEDVADRHRLAGNVAVMAARACPSATIDGDVLLVAVVTIDELHRLNKHAAGAAAGVIDLALCLYSEDSTLPRNLFAVSHSVSSKPFPFGVFRRICG